MKFRTILVSLLGLAVAAFAAVQIVDLGRQAARIAPTDEVLETYAPNTGPLSRPTRSIEVESQPLAATITAPPIPPTQQAGGSPTPATLEATAQDNTGDAGPGVGDPAEGVFFSVPETEPTRVRPTQDQPALPTRIVIPALKLDAPVLPAGSQKIRLGSETVYQWKAPDEFAAGWHTSSAYLGEVGNTVLSGHNNMDGSVFGNLFRLKNGDAIDVYAGERVFHYLVTQTVILEEADQPVQKRLENARWISQSDDIRLTLVTCWPNDGNTHRLYVVAVPAR